jgi:hypothetical protein
MEEKVAVLEKVVTGREQLEALTSMLLAHDKRVDAFFLQQSKQEQAGVAQHEELKGLLISNKRVLAEVLEAVKAT